MYIEQLVGFDVREMYFPAESWDSDYRQSYLLREVERPFTVDPRIWRSMFEIIDPSLEFNGPRQFTASDLREMMAVLEGHQTFLKPCWVMAFTEFISEHEPETLWTEPAAISKEWRLLGYDVADAGWFSFLCDAGPGDKIDQYRVQWGSHLNEYHLFSDISIAQAFADMNEAREPMHGPYAVHGLYVVQSIGL